MTLTQRTMKNLIENVAISIAFPMIIFLVSPLTMALGNRDEFPQGFSIGPVLVFFFASCSILFTVWLAQKLNLTSYRLLAALLVSLGLCAWIQSQLLVWDFGPLDGRGLLWESFQAQSIIEATIWMIGIALAIILSRKRHVLTLHLATVVLVLGSGSLISAYATVEINEKSKGQGATGSQRIAFISEQDAFRFHPNTNTIILVLDTFQSDAFNEIATRYPAEVEFLRGFQFFPDAVAGYPTTKHSIPLILTGNFYTNQEPHTEKYLAKLLNSSLTLNYQDAGYRTAMFAPTISKSISHLHTKPILITPAITNFNYLGLSRNDLKLIDVGLFRASPIFLKKLIYDEGRWALTEASARQHSPHQAPSWQGDDWRIAQSFLKYARIDPADSGAFTFIHLMGAHAPISIDENYRYTPNLSDTRDNYVNQARGVLKLTKQLIEKLETLDVYKDAEIIIIGDHGAHNKAPADMLDSEFEFDYSPSIIGAARPIFLYKRTGETTPLTINSTPVHLADIACLLKPGCQSHIKTGEPPPKVRQHYRYEWRHEFWFRDYSPPMTLYEVIGDARKYSDWRNTGRIFSDGSESTDRFKRYAANEVIDFSQSGNTEQFIFKGISAQEPGHRWSDGDILATTLHIDREIKAPAWLNVRGAGFSPDGGASPQRVQIAVNGQPLGVWDFPPTDTDIKVALPADALDLGVIRLKFIFEKPTAPCAISESADCRKLGVAFKQLSITRE